MSGARVFVYGMGVSCAAGDGVESAWSAWRSGASRLAPLATAATASPVFAGLAPARRDDPAAAPPGPTVLSLARAALREALGEAGSGGGLDLVVGTTVGLGGDTAHAPVGAPFGELAERLASECGFERASTVNSGCTASMEAIATAAARIRAGLVAGAVAGGADALSDLVLRGFDCLGMLAPSAPRPFDRGRCGCALADGAAFLVLMEEKECRRRRLRPLAELLGSSAGISDHPSSLAEPEGLALAETVAAALEAARVGPADLAFVQAFGLGTPAGDLAEANALRTALSGAPVPITGAKGILGHTLGAAGALEAALAVRALREGVVPPLAGLADLDPGCALPGLVREETAVRSALALEVGVGLCGQAAALVWRRAA